MEKKTNTNSSKQSGIMSSIKKIFGKFKKSGKTETENKKRKVFNLTRKDAVISITITLLVVAGAAFYGMQIRNKYVELNNQKDSLKNLSTYGSKVSNELGDEARTINEAFEIYENVESEIKDYEEFEEQQRSYYEVLLQNIYLPSLNIWKDPYTKNLDLTILGQKYLDMDKFQDLYLIQYWSDFFKYVGSDIDYNTIESISIGDKIIVENNPNYFYVPISISFTSPNKRSFLLLVNKLSTTSNKANISLVNEIFFYLLNVIKKNKQEVIKQLMEKYWEEFSSSSNWDLGKNLGELTPEQESQYMDKIIGYYLYHLINGDGAVEDEVGLIDNEIIEDVVRQVSLCKASDSKQKCFYDFREKYRDLPYLAYNIGLEKQGDRVDGLLSFLQGLSPIITITDFQFEKYSNSTFLNNEGEQYEGSISFNAYGRNVTDDELDEVSTLLGNLCFGNNSNQKISPELALQSANKVIGSLGEKREYSNISSLGELQGLFTEIDLIYEGLTNYDKMIKLFEIWRMMNDANLCA